MEILKDITKKLYNYSFLRYALIGGTTFAIDFGLLVFFHGFGDINLLLATSVAYWTSIAFNFLANRFWTFGATQTPIAKHAVAYIILLAFNYLFTLGFVALATYFGLHYAVAKIIAVGIQIIWTYYTYKNIIFR